MVDVGAAFSLSRDRDAYASIRGFVLQADRTILAWLSLGDAEVLELERGEDIDRIAAALSGSEGSPTRILEQVKHSERSITLRSEDAVASLVNFHEHRLANPAIRLLFRFTTTAGIGREKKSPLPDGLRGIEAWELVRESGAEGAKADELLRALRRLVAQAKRPPEIPSDAWAGFQAFLRNDESAWAAFVRDFEWSTGAPDSNALRPVIKNRLKADFDVLDNEVAYRHLFASVFDLLCTKGIKCLTRSEALTILKDGPHEAARGRLSRLEFLHAVLEAKVDRMGESVEYQGRVVALLNERVQELSASTGVTIAASEPLPPSLTPPPQPVRVSLRAGTLSNLGVESRSGRVFAWWGSVSCGKSQLASLAAQRLGGSVRWFRLDPSGPAAAVSVLGTSLRALLVAEKDPRRTAQDWSVLASAAAEHAGVMVIDDVPQFRTGDELGSRLLPLLRACLVAGTPVVVTSAVPLVALEHSFEESELATTMVPPFTEEEIRELLLAYGAPSSMITDGVLRILLGTTGGHPLIVHAAIRFLSERSWSVNMDTFGALLQRQFAGGLRVEALQALLNEVTERPTRELLYRLSILQGAFSVEDCSAIASAPPPISTPAERLASVTGPWVQAMEGSRFRLSPLLRTIGSEDLTAEVRQACHEVAGRTIVKRSRIDEGELLEAITHFVQAGSVEAAGQLLLQGLHGSLEARRKGLGLVDAIWLDTPLPEAMSPALRAMIRAQQIALAARKGRKVQGLVVDLDWIMMSGKLDPRTEFLTASMVAVHLAFSRTSMTAPFLRRALTLFPAFVQREDRRDAPEMDVSDPGTLAWLGAQGALDEADLLAWLSVVASLAPEVRGSVFSSVMAPEAAANLANRPVMWQYGASVETRDWKQAAQTLEKVERAADEMQALPLWAGARAARIVAVAEEAKDSGRAEPLAEAGFARCRDYPNGSFLIAKAMGYSAKDAGKRASAVEWLRRARAIPADAHGRERVEVRLRLAELLSDHDREAAVEVARDAVTLARSTRLDPYAVDESIGAPRPGDTCLPKAVGELAIALWLAGDRTNAIRTWCEAIDELLARRDDTGELWVPLFVVMGHVSGYLATTIMTGAPPAEAKDGEVYAPPRQAMLLAPSAQTASLFRPEMVPMLGVHVAMMAEAAGDATSVVTWARRSADQLRSAGLWGAAVVPLHMLADHAVCEGRFSEAIDYATEAVAAQWVGLQKPREQWSAFEVTGRPEDAIGATSSEAWNSVDGRVISQVVLGGFLLTAAVGEVDPERARVLAAALHAACAAQAEDRDGAGLWSEACTVLDLALAERVDLEALRRKGEALKERGDEFTTFFVITQIAASRDPSLDPLKRLVFQLGGAKYCEQLLQLNRSIGERAVLAFFVPFWTRTFEAARFHFNAPTLVARQLLEASGAPPSLRLRRVFLTIVDGLGARVPAWAREWLRGA